jgi:hypothetical protein
MHPVDTAQTKAGTMYVESVKLNVEAVVEIFIRLD